LQKLINISNFVLSSSQNLCSEFTTSKKGQLDQLPAFSPTFEFPRCPELGSVYDPVKEFERLGVSSRTNKWRFSKINENFEVSK
jgi:hypothetical protein